MAQRLELVVLWLGQFVIGGVPLIELLAWRVQPQCAVARALAQ